MSIRALVSVAGHDIPEPHTYSSTTATFVDMERNAQGHIIGAVVRDSVAKVEMEWAFLSAEKWSGILRLFNERLGGSFTNNVTFFDQDSNDWDTREMYVSDKTAKMFQRDRNTGKVLGYNNCRVAFIEM